MNIKSYKETSRKRHKSKKIGIIISSSRKIKIIKVPKNTKNLINFKPKTRNNNIKYLYVDGGKISSNPLKISNFFNKHFTTVAVKIESKIVKTNKNFIVFI